MLVEPRRIENQELNIAKEESERTELSLRF
jgi:hypothetical protein